MNIFERLRRHPALAALFAKYRLHFNALSLAFVRPFSLLVSLLVAPIYLQYTGAELFGVYAFFFALCTRVIALDFGVQTILTKEFSLLRDGKHHQLRQLFHHGMTIYGLVGLVFALFCVAMGFFANDLFAVPPELHGWTLRLGLLAAVTSLLWVSLRPFEAILDGLELQMVRNVPSLLAGTCNLVLAIVVLRWKIPLMVFFGLSFLTYLIPGVWNVVVVWRLGIWKKIAADGDESQPSRRWRDTVSASWPIFFNQLVATLQLEAPNFLSGLYAGPTGLALYSLAMRPVFFIRVLTSQVSLAFMPRMVRLHAQKDPGALLAFARKPAILVCTASLFMAFMYAAAAEPFLTVWLRKSGLAPDVLWPSVLCAFAYAANSFSAITGRCVTYIGGAQKLNRVAVVGVASGIMAAAALGRYFDLNGILSALLLQNILLGWAINRIFLNYIEMREGIIFGVEFWRKIVPLGLLALGILFLGVAAQLRWGNMIALAVVYAGLLVSVGLHQWKTYRLGDM